jgi:uncharacterized membrane protein
MLWFLVGVAALHAVFMGCELFPWSNPVLLRIVSKKLPAEEKFRPEQIALVATIVHNTGIYNSIIAEGLLWAAAISDPAIAAAVARVLLLGAGVAGAFGTATLKSPLTAMQALVGFVGFFLV